MAKSHFFVQNGSGFIKEGYKQCPYCGVLFKPIHGNQKYCCQEHYQENAKKLRSEWKKEHRQEIYRRENERRRRLRSDNKTTYVLLLRARKKRNRVIKAALIDMTLMTFQRREDAKNDPTTFDWRKAYRKRYNPDKVLVIKAFMRRKGLYTDQIESSGKYPLNFSDQAKKGKIKIPGDLVIPELPIKKPTYITANEYLRSVNS